MDRHPLKALVGKRSVPMDRHLLQVLVTREPRHLLQVLVTREPRHLLQVLVTREPRQPLKIHMGIEIMVTREPMMEVLDMLVIMGARALDMVGTL